MNEYIKNIKNMTPHEIVVYLDEGNIKIPSEGVVRVAETRKLLKEVEGIKIYSKTFGTSDELPPRTEGQYIIVSVPVAQAHPERKDLIIPDDLVRNEGKIVGCKSFAILNIN
jgi:hypothetical protein